MEKIKLRKRIQNKENYYLEMKNDNDEIHILNKNNEIVLSLTMNKEGIIELFGRGKAINRNVEFLHKCDNKDCEAQIREGIRCCSQECLDIVEAN